jgi:hypothetical protein
MNTLSRYTHLINTLSSLPEDSEYQPLTSKSINVGSGQEATHSRPIYPQHYTQTGLTKSQVLPDEFYTLNLCPAQKEERKVTRLDVSDNRHV